MVKGIVGKYLFFIIIVPLTQHQEQFQPGSVKLLDYNSTVLLSMYKGFVSFYMQAQNTCRKNSMNTEVHEVNHLLVYIV